MTDKVLELFEEERRQINAWFSEETKKLVGEYHDRMMKLMEDMEVLINESKSGGSVDTNT